MKITLKRVTIRELADGFEEKEQEGVVAYGGLLDVRPAYQREFVYKDPQRDAVIDTVSKNFPLNVMYWAVTGDGRYEIIDGQQRTISICRYVKGIFSIKEKLFHSVQPEAREDFLNYELTIYICEGNNTDKLDWFETINIAGEKLLDQELRNATYSGPWLSDAKRYFSRKDCVAYSKGHKYLEGSPIRQQYLESALKWINDGKIVEYMSTNQFKESAVELWEYFEAVIEWVEKVFPVYRKEMKGVQWGDLYNQYKGETYDSDALELEVSNLMKDDEFEVTNKKGIYQYLLSGDRRFLNNRKFTDNEKRAVYERQGGKCIYNGHNKEFLFEEMQGDHIIPWSKGGKTKIDNLQMLCGSCNQIKSDD